MHFWEIILILFLNISIVLMIQRQHQRSLDQNLNNIRMEVQELEVLVAELIEELEDISGLGEFKEPVDTAEDLHSIKPETREPPLEQIIESNSNQSKPQRIIGLSKQGLDASEIARELGIGQGEVNLILGLHRRS